MKKCILLLINGFGIERKDSVEIFSASLMPNLDSLSKKYVFGSLTSIVNDYNNGYRIFSIPQEKSSVMDAVDRAIEDKSINSNQGILSLENDMPSSNKIHIFYTMEDVKKLFQIRELLHIINSDKNKRIYLHIVLMSSSIDDYNEIDKTMSKLAFELGEYCKIGIVVGKNKISEENITKTILREYGEHWVEYAKKIETLKRDAVNPQDANVFYVNGGFQLTKGDKALFLNYKNVDFSTLTSVFTSNGIDLYSLYEMTNCVHLFKKDEQNIECFISKLEKTNSKALLLTDKEKINDINFYLNGMQVGTSSKMVYAVRNINLLKNKESFKNLLGDNQYDGVIIDFNISSYNKIDEIKAKLKEIDEIIKPLEEVSIELGVTFIISSLFGMYASVMDGPVQKTVNFSGKVPCIVISKDFDKKNYSIADKDTYDLSGAFLSSITDQQIGGGILHKKSALEKLLKK